MYIVKTKTHLKTLLQKFTTQNLSIGFVPTMGALHDGHLALVKKAKTQNHIIVVSIFINPTQFNNPDDLQKYPQQIQQDITLLLQHQCDILFYPSTQEMYPHNDTPLTYPLHNLDNIFEGFYRPNHFQGVCQIVHKLLNLVQPQNLYLGQKDFQQCLVIQKLVHFLNIPTNISIVPTIREQNGLAKSSRNQRLNDADKQNANLIFQCLNNIKQHLLSTNLHTFPSLQQTWQKKLLDNGFQTEYLNLVNCSDLSHPTNTLNNTILIIAVYFKGIRLIDNLLIHE